MTMPSSTSDPLTIVLTLKDRSPFTYRWMQYMDDVRCPYPILIADGGTDQAIEDQLKNTANYPHLRYSYLRYPVDTDHPTFFRKFDDVISQVTTPYVLLADNDDFYVLDHVPEITAFLDQHADVVSCGGTPTVLRLYHEDGSLARTPVAADYSAKPDRRPKQVVGATGTERLVYFFENAVRHYLWSSWHYVHRTAALQRATAMIREHRFADPVSLEIHLNVWLLLTGSFQTLDVPLLITQQGASQLSGAIDAQANLIERFVASNAFADIHRSLESFTPPVSEADRERIYKAVAKFIADTAKRVYPAAPAANNNGVAARSPSRVKDVARMLVPPLLWSMARRVLRGRSGPMGNTLPVTPPKLEYAPRGWDTPVAVTGWDFAGVVREEERKWDAFRANAAGAGPLGFSHEVDDPSIVNNPGHHNLHMTFAYVLARAANGRRRMSVLDWGGALGHHYLIARAVLPDVSIEYHVREQPRLAERGRALNPEVQWHDDDQCLSRAYDLVIVSGSLQCMRDARPFLSKAAAAVANGGSLFLTRVPVVEGASFVAVQRVYGGTMFHEQFNRTELLAIVGASGLQLVREFVIGDRPKIVNAPEQCEVKGWLFDRRA